MSDPCGNDAETRPVLDYCVPAPRNISGLSKLLANLGPWWIRPSWFSLLLLVLLAASVIAARRSLPSWTAVAIYKTAVPSITYGMESNAIFVPLPSRNAVICLDAAGCPIVWRPWDNKTLLKLPTAGTYVQWFEISADQSTLLAQLADNRVFLWDVQTGKILRSLWAPDLYKFRYNFPGSALSPDGSTLATIESDGRLTTLDITGMQPQTLAVRQFNDSPSVLDKVAFSPDGTRLVFFSGGFLREICVLDSRTLKTVVASAPNAGAADCAFQWLNGGKEIIVAGNLQNSLNCSACLYDCQSGKILGNWTFQDLLVNSLTVSPDQQYVLIGARFGGAAATIELSATGAKSQRQALIASLPDWQRADFFPDSRRVLSYSGWYADPVIIDLAANAHLATLRLPPPTGRWWNPYPPVVGAVISNDGNQIATQLGDGRVVVYHHLAPDTRWGIMASPLFWLVGALLAAFTYSLWKDTARQSTGDGIHRAAALMVIASYLPLLSICGILAEGDFAVAKFLLSPFVLLGVPWFPAAIGVRAGSKFWIAIACALLFTSMYTSFNAIFAAPELAKTPFHIFDRMVLLSPWLLAPAFICGFFFCVAAIFLLFRDAARLEANRKDPTPMTKSLPSPTI